LGDERVQFDAGNFGNPALIFGGLGLNGTGLKINGFERV
jgi:hypothetical protein